MAKLRDIPFKDESDFSKCQYIQANGSFGSGPLMTTGVPDRIWIEEASCKMYLNINDVDTAGWKRSEIVLGTFPTGAGEYWSTCDFKYDWDTDKNVAIGSWYATPDSGDGLKYVPIGFRIRYSALVIEVPIDPPTEGIGSKAIASAPIVRNRWYSLCVHANLQPNNKGFREVFLDKAPIVREYGIPTAYVDVVGPYFKMGPYDGDHLLRFDEATLYVRNVTMWSGNDGYQNVMGGVPLSPPRLIDV